MYIYSLYEYFSFHSSSQIHFLFYEYTSNIFSIKMAAANTKYELNYFGKSRARAHTHKHSIFISSITINISIHLVYNVISI